MRSPIDPYETPGSLLKQLRHVTAATAAEAWKRFVFLYTPLLLLWSRRLGATEEEAGELVQEVFTTLAREMPRFELNPAQRFRGWLWTLLRNKRRDHLRRRLAAPASTDSAALANLASVDNVAEFAEEEYRSYLISRAMEIMRAELPALEYRACQEYILADRPAAEVARDLGLTVNQVYLAKSRILQRIRSVLEGLLD